MYTTREAAAQLGLSPHTVLKYTLRYGVGQKKGPIWLLSESDMDTIERRMRRRADS
jgi:hypothetical protein